MRKTTTDDQTVTKDFLEQRLEVTTEALIDEMDKRETNLIKEMDKRHNLVIGMINNLQNYFIEEVKKMRMEADKRHSQSMTSFDGIVKELEIAREDREIALSSELQIKKQVKDHEKRLKKVEKAVQTS